MMTFEDNAFSSTSLHSLSLTEIWSAAHSFWLMFGLTMWIRGWDFSECLLTMDGF